MPFEDLRLNQEQARHIEWLIDSLRKAAAGNIILMRESIYGLPFEYQIGDNPHLVILKELQEKNQNLEGEIKRLKHELERAKRPWWKR